MHIPDPVTIADIVGDVKTGRRSARHTTEAALASIEAGRTLNAFVHVDPEHALQQADAVDRRVAGGADLALAGVPVGIKDVIAVAGLPLTLGSRVFADHRADQDAIAVHRLKRAGAVIIGMTNTSEFACKGVTTNPLYGPTRHPLDPDLTPGGSSGGSASAVAGGLVPFALGTDSGGSARRPAAHSGIVGFKPSFGAVPNGPGLPGASFGINCVAPMTRTVRDARTVFEILAGPDPLDPDSQVSIGRNERQPRELRIGYSPRFGFNSAVDPAIAAALDRAFDGFRKRGVTVVAIDPVWPDNVNEAGLMPLQHAGLASLYGAIFRKDPGLFDPDIAVQIERGLGLGGTAVTDALLLSKEIKRRTAAVFHEVDLLIGPTVPCFAWPHARLGPDEIDGQPVSPRAHAVFTPFFNHALVPAISIPLPMGDGSLPAGLQIVGPRGSDYRVLDFASFAEQIFTEETCR